jgi:hypothetical protein
VSEEPIDPFGGRVRDPQARDQVGSRPGGNRRLAVAFVVLLVLLVAARLAHTWMSGPAGGGRRAVVVVLLVLFVGVPAAYGIRGLLRDDP